MRETNAVCDTRAQKLWNMIISGVTWFSWLKQSFASLDMSVIIVNWSSEPPREQLNMNGLVLM